MSMKYKESGVDTELADKLVTDMGFDKGFGASVGVNGKQVVLSTDGVGTKLLLTKKFDKVYDTIGIDLVAMCVNDIICQGATPKAFLDYYAVGHLDYKTAIRILNGIKKGCRQAECDLVGGETAEMPDVYSNKTFDLAGFAMGVVEDFSLPRPMIPGDVLFALPSSGFHSNGYSLIRKQLKKYRYDFPEEYMDEILAPTRIYVKEFKQIKPYLLGLANITGGGIHGNLPRIFSKHLTYSITETVLPPSQQFLYNTFNERVWECRTINQMGMQQFESTFNCGYGMIGVVSKDNIDKITVEHKVIGEVISK